MSMVRFTSSGAELQPAYRASGGPGYGEDTPAERYSAAVKVWRTAARLLSHRDLAVMAMLYGEGMDGGEVAHALDLTRQRIAQIEKRCIKALRLALA